jgi:hypothetical protein
MMPKMYLEELGIGGCRCFYSVEFRELVFPETELPAPIILGNSLGGRA